MRTGQATEPTNIAPDIYSRGKADATDEYLQMQVHRQSTSAAAIQSNNLPTTSIYIATGRKFPPKKYRLYRLLIRENILGPPGRRRSPTRWEKTTLT